MAHWLLVAYPPMVPDLLPPSFPFQNLKINRSFANSLGNSSVSDNRTTAFEHRVLDRKLRSGTMPYTHPDSPSTKKSDREHDPCDINRPVRAGSP
jgi:hypothetical protein